MENDLHGLCPHCGEPLKPSATFCRECGSSDESGWNETEEGFAEEEFDYDEFVQREFPSEAPPGNLDVKHIAIASVIIIVLAAFLLLTIFGY